MLWRSVRGRREGWSLAGGPSPPSSHHPATPRRDEVAMRGPPPGRGGRVGEVDVALPLPVVGVRRRSRARSLRPGGSPRDSASAKSGDSSWRTGYSWVMTSKCCERISSSRPAGSGAELGLKLEVSDAPVPAERVAVGREVDQRVAGNSFLAQRARQLPELRRVVEMAGRLQVAERPSRRQRRAPEQLAELAHDAAQVAAMQEVPVERAGLRGVDDDGRRHPIGRRRCRRRPDCRRRAHSPALDTRIGTPMSEPGPWPRWVFQSWRVAPSRSKPTAALAQAVKVLLAGEREAGEGGDVRTRRRSARRTCRRRGARGGASHREDRGRPGEEGPSRSRPQVGRAEAERLPTDHIDRRGRPFAVAA